MHSDSKSIHKRLPVPPGVFRCLVCNEWRGTAKALDIFGPEHHFYKDEDPEKPVTISCVCDGIPCRKCNKNLIHRPISNQWDEYNGFGHNFYLAGLMPCKECAPRTQTFDEIIENFEKKHPDKAHQGERGKPSTPRDGGIALIGGKGKPTAAKPGAPASRGKPRAKREQKSAQERPLRPDGG